jgi:isopentenyldiphosphate isomerase
VLQYYVARLIIGVQVLLVLTRDSSNREIETAQFELQTAWMMQDRTAVNNVILIGTRKLMASWRRKSAAMLIILLLMVMVMFMVMFRQNKQTINTDEELQVYELVPGSDPPAFLQQVNLAANHPLLRPLKQFQSIDLTHRRADYHVGAVMLVMDVTGEYLLLVKRGPQLVTCPNTWGFVGEHALRREPPLATIQRGLMEELWTTTTTQDQRFLESQVAFYQNLTAYPVLYHRVYPNQRTDRQLTYIYEVRLKQPHDQIVLQLDHEVADHQWITLQDFRQKLEDTNKEEYWCHHTLIELFQLALKQLEMARTSMREPTKENRW